MMDQTIGFCTAADGVRICYATIGEGPPIVKAPNWLTHLEYEWQSPVWRHWWEELAQHHTLIRFDQRGSGLSDRNVDTLTFDDCVSDLEAVVDCLGLDNFIMLGISQGGAFAVEYIARHPDKVNRLILYGAYPRGGQKRGESAEEHNARLTLTRHGWGRDDPAYRQFFTSKFMPEATVEQANWFNELQRVSTSPENAARVMMMTGGIDVLDRVPLVRVPTLVLHVRDDRQIPFEQGRQMASLIPGAKFQPLEGKNHLLVQSEPAWQVCQEAVREFLGIGSSLAEETAPAVTPRVYPDGLTAREVEVLQLMAYGRSNREIAEALIISLNTVTNHVKSILGKTGCSNRTEAASYAFSRDMT